MATPYAGYIDPFADAKVTGERVDQGVDYAGSGSIAALGAAVVTQVVTGKGSGWPGNFVEYQLTDGPLQGQYVYAAEGVTPTVQVGQKLTAGQVIATLIPGWSTGIETGFGSGRGTSTYAAAEGGGYTEGQRTEAGHEFDVLMRALGAPGSDENVIQLTKKGSGTGPVPGGVTVKPGSLPGQIIGTGENVVNTGADITSAVGNFLSNPVPALLTIGLVGLGALMIFSGVGRMLGFDTPVKSTAGKIPVVGAALG